MSKPQSQLTPIQDIRQSRRKRVQIRRRLGATHLQVLRPFDCHIGLMADRREEGKILAVEVNLEIMDRQRDLVIIGWNVESWLKEALNMTGVADARLSNAPFLILLFIPSPLPYENNRTYSKAPLKTVVNSTHLEDTDTNQSYVKNAI